MSLSLVLRYYKSMELMGACRFIPAYVAAAVALVVSVFINVSLPLPTLHFIP